MEVEEGSKTEDSISPHNAGLVEEQSITYADIKNSLLCLSYLTDKSGGRDSYIWWSPVLVHVT